MYQMSRGVGPLVLILSVAVGCSRKRVSPTPIAPVDRAAGEDGARRDASDAEVFIERIPSVETRDYVRIVLRNMTWYRRLYAL